MCRPVERPQEMSGCSIISAEGCRLWRCGHSGAGKIWTAWLEAKPFEFRGSLSIPREDLLMSKTNGTRTYWCPDLLVSVQLFGHEN